MMADPTKLTPETAAADPGAWLRARKWTLSTAGVAALTFYILGIAVFATSPVLDQPLFHLGTLGALALLCAGAALFTTPSIETAVSSFSSRVFAVALLTIREIYRRKFFMVLGFFTIGIVSVFGLAPGLEPEATLRIMETWIFRAVVFFVAILTVFLAGYSVPRDIERRQIYMLASKPISKATILIGKFVGFAAVLLISLAAMAIISILILRGSQLVMSPSFSLQVRPRSMAQLHPIPGNVDRGTSPDSATRFNGGGPADVPLRFRFTRLDPTAFPMAVPCRFKLGVGNFQSMLDQSADLKILFINPETRASQEIECPEVLTNEWYELDSERGVRTFPRTLISGAGELEVEIRRIQPNNYMWLRRRDLEELAGAVQIFSDPELFEVTLFKGMLLVLLEGLFLLALVLGASTLLSAPVSLFLGMSAFLICTAYGFLNASVEDVTYFLAELEAEGEQDHGHRTHGLPPWLLKVSATVSRGMLAVVPDFNRLDPTAFLLEDIAVPMHAVWRGVRGVALQLMLCLLIGCIGISLRDYS